MNTSDYLKTQADLLVAAQMLRRLKLDDFIRKCDEIGSNELQDHEGLPVITDAARMRRLAESAKQFLNGDRHAETKPSKSHLGRRA